MKKVVALFSSLLVIVGAKAQNNPAPVVKKETVKPTLPKPVSLDSTAVAKPGTTIKQTNKAIKFDQIKKEAPATYKQAPVAKPHKD
ncbi:hypothetical protein [Ferruginibacter sp.]